MLQMFIVLEEKTCIFVIVLNKMFEKYYAP